MRLRRLAGVHLQRALPMKATEILLRQNRVVYILMVLVASLGLLWSFWQHQHPASDAAHPRPLPGQPAHQAIVLKH